MQHGIKGNQLLFLMWMSSDDLELANNGDAHFEMRDERIVECIISKSRRVSYKRKRSV